MIDTEGFGIHKMFVSQKDRYLPMPDYDKSDSDTVVLTKQVEYTLRKGFNDAECQVKSVCGTWRNLREIT